MTGLDCGLVGLDSRVPLWRCLDGWLELGDACLIGNILRLVAARLLVATLGVSNVRGWFGAGLLRPTAVEAGEQGAEDGMGVGRLSSVLTGGRRVGGPLLCSVWQPRRLPGRSLSVWSSPVRGVSSGGRVMTRKGMVHDGVPSQF
jgi:hypothetical protein